MSIFSDYECGALSDNQFKFLCNRMNAEERYYEDLEHRDIRSMEMEKEDEKDDEN